jgi:hypothetical protein
VNGIAGWSQTGTSEIVTEGTVDFDGESQGMKLRSDSDDHPVLVLRNFHEEEVLLVLVPVRSCQAEHIKLEEMRKENMGLPRRRMYWATQGGISDCTFF